MLELPELETLRRDLDREVGGKRIKTADTPGRTAFGRLPKKQVQSRLEGAKVSGVERRGTLFVLKLDTGELGVIDVSKGGSLRRTTPKQEVAKGTQLVITFTQGGQLRLVDTDSAAEVWVTTPEELPAERPELTTLGLDPLDEPISWTTFGHLLVRRAGTLQAVLSDPTAVVGLGPLYVDEILHAAGLRHDRQSNRLSSQEMRRLYRALVEVLHESAKRRGTTLPSNGFADLSGKPGEYQLALEVVERDGQPCRRCRGVVSKSRAGGRTIYWCESCQN